MAFMIQVIVYQYLMEDLTKPPKKFSFHSDGTVLELFIKHKSNIVKGQEKLHWYKYIQAKYKNGMEVGFALEELQWFVDLKCITIINDG